jgi:hypothetical protein
MADNLAVTPGTGATVAADDIGGVLYQRVKLALGADGTGVDASAGAGAVGTGVQRTTLASDDPAVTSLAVMDDWDESDRAKVNIIAGQAGVAAGAGAVGATVPRVTLASDDPAVAALQRFSQAVEYETVAASQTDQVLGASGAQGDYLSGLLVVPASTSPGNVLIQDGNGSDITVFTGGASSVSNLVPFFVPLGLTAVNGTSAGWKVTTGASVSVIASGNFT